MDVRRAHNLRVPSDAHRSGQLTFAPDRTRGVDGGLGLATFLLGDVTSFGRFVSTSTDARERQWRHFYYAQDTWRVEAKLTLNYGLRLDVINPQTVNEAGNGGFLDLTTGEILVAGVGGIGLNGNVKNTLNWAPRLGATYQLTQKTVLRAGFGRSYDIGVFGSLFGHTVTQNLPVLSNQNLNAPNNFDAVFNLAQGPPGAGLPGRAGERPVPAAEWLGRPRADAEAAAAHGGRVERYGAAPAHQHAVGRGGVRRQPRGRTRSSATARPPTRTSRRSSASPRASRPTCGGRSSPATWRTRRASAGRYGWTQGFDYFCNCATN